MNEYLKNLKKIEFVVTMACTGKCRHCSEGDHSGCTEHIDGAVAAEAVREICSCYDISTVMTFGGEPLLFPAIILRNRSGSLPMRRPRRRGRRPCRCSR